MIIVNNLFQFKPPNRLSEEEYLDLKRHLTKYPSYDFLQNISFYNERKAMILFVSIASVLSLILFSIQREGINVAIGGLLMTFALISGLFFLLPEYLSFVKMKNQMTKYFDKLKRTIINTNNYSEFILNW